MKPLMTIAQDFDPDAVDFEPLLVTGTGKILSYHSESFKELEEIDSDCSSVATPIVRNGVQNMRQPLRVERFVRQTSVRTPYRSIRLFSSFFILGFLALGGLFWFMNDASNNTYRLQTTDTKKSMVNKLNTKKINHVLQNHIMDVNVAAFKASKSQITFWEPYLERSTSSSFEVLNSLMNIMSQCFAREVLNFHMEKSGSYELKPPQIQDGFSSSLIISPDVDTPKAIFTPNFMQAANDLLDPFNQGAFITIFHDPIEMYFDHHVKQREEEKSEKLKLTDNLLVRFLSGVNDVDRKVNKGDYDIARHILVSKFVIGSCDDPAETLNRLDKMIIDSDSIIIASGECTNARQRWNQECKKLKKVGQRIKGNQSYRKLLKRITNINRYDIQLYEESRKLFREQSALFR